MELLNTQDKSAKALVVLSGGQDSTTCLFWARRHFGEVHAITFDYGQRHSAEIEAAVKVGKLAGVESHELVRLGPDVLKGMSPLTNRAEKLETYDSFEQMEKTIGNRIELTFVPMRNALFLVIAANRAAIIGASYLVTGVCQQDGTNYPDCRDSFIKVTEKMIRLALEKDGFTIVAPLMHMSKSDSIKLALELPGCYEALGWSHTAYDGQYPPIGKDHASVLRAHGFEMASVADPLVVRAWREGLMDLPETANYAVLKEAT